MARTTVLVYTIFTMMKGMQDANATVGGDGNACHKKYK